MSNTPSVNEFQVILIHGGDRHSILCHQDDHLNELQVRIQELTHIPPSGQRIIFKGRSLSDLTKTLQELGITRGSKIMVLGQSVEPSTDEMYKEIQKVDQNCGDLERKLGDISSALDGMEKGYLKKQMQVELLPKFEHQLKVVSENCMQLLEKLDSVECNGCSTETRVKRKQVVQRIQGLLDRSDSIQESVTQLASSD